MPRIRHIQVDKDDHVIEFRFKCPASLREKVIERLKEIRYDRSSMMCAFLEEWLKQTEVLLEQEKKSAATQTKKPRPSPQKATAEENSKNTATVAYSEGNPHKEATLSSEKQKLKAGEEVPQQGAS